MTATTEKPSSATDFATEVVTHSLVRDVALPGGAGTLALITLDNGHDHTRPNTFGPASLAELAQVVQTLHRRAAATEITAVAVTGKPFVFAVGADLSGVPHVAARKQALEIARAGHAAFAAFEDLPVPTFAFVNGAVMGGGLELALSATYRTMSAGVPAVALPEVFLGLVPGWGGCWRLPNLVGIERALTVVVENPLAQNRMLKGPDAHRLGLSDVLLEPADFIEESVAWAARVLSGEVVVERPDVDHDEAAWSAAVAKARALADAKTGRQARSPYVALDLLAAARTATREEGFAAEDDALADLIMTDELRAGLYAFDLVQKRAKRPAGAPDRSLARKVTKVGIVGAGLMAGQLALLVVQRLQVPVVLTDVDEARLAQGVGYVHAELEKLAGKGRLSPDRLRRLSRLVTGSVDKAGFADADLVIEAVFEEMAVKQQVFAEVEAVVGAACVLATNTSSLSVTEMGSRLQHPERVVGLHFFNPVAVMPLLEVIPGEHTDEATLATAFAVGASLRKTCIRAADRPSFVVNRLLGRFMGEAARIVDEGTPIEVVDRAFAGLAPMPPFVLIGLVGPAIALHNGETLVRAFPDRFWASPTLKRVVESGRRGFYDLSSGRPVLDPEVLELVETPADPVVLDVAAVRERVLRVLADEARRMLDEGVVASPKDLDLAMITGAGFQFWNGGLTPLLDRTGVAEAVTGTRFLPPGVAQVAAPG
ncbi:3-hydroxyacyl-CoA dehydrogenase NAD-binding domain-containing protein [Terracoccus luteus]|uniref:3-hydroxyacyl-CoA dehydrogenase/enoyl-CoA hydratase/carnithine racemase n=1 Tax=Terracoccus luteus TaxID=53356 RepID=A0A839PP76_9MICO|nr:3-hydroxyacyl-CoA dehydrogenase NAD-binding domain-containing protein [Terracoccus luteus]MBB2984879.1 3-hydroxyacyl-CoA dehydrogenase/enoyl-CoA hydratase/carnithine racemase [Terracoccus luteus]MCP2170531.1 3-hydroxyacyl-CoA dehydrogenase/enoyl-CoA hydratase/carnithine racemase [Terracoccus luteus]